MLLLTNFVKDNHLKSGAVDVAGERTQWRFASVCPLVPPDPQIMVNLFLLFKAIIVGS